MANRVRALHRPEELDQVRAILCEAQRRLDGLGCGMVAHNVANVSQMLEGAKVRIGLATRPRRRSAKDDNAV